MDTRPVEPFEIRPARSPRELDAARSLFAAYAASLPIDLGYQGFDCEVAELPGKYAPPRGELLVAWDGFARAVGCVGLRPLGDSGACELKRLYVAPRARSSGLGRMLADAIVEIARADCYLRLVLDTLPGLVAAVRLYERMGFRRIAPYYGPTPPGSIFMELDLRA